MLAPAEGYLTRPDETSPLPLALMENRARTDILSLESFDPETYPGPMVKALYLYQPESSRRAAQNDARAVQDLLFRAVTDRGLRLLILTPLQDAEGNPVTDPAVYRDMLEGLEKRLEARGYTFGKTFSCMDYRPAFSPDALRLWAGIPPLLLGCWLLLQLMPGLNKWGRWLYPAALLLYVLAANILDARFFLVVQLAGVMVFSCCTAWFVAEYVRTSHEKPLWQTVPVFTAALTGWSLLGGLWISALMSTHTYLLGCAVFSGEEGSYKYAVIHTGQDIRQFMSEVRMMTDLHHQGIVQGYGADCVDGRYYLIMDYVDGYTFGSLQNRKKRISESDALIVCESVADAMKYAWDLFGIVHCDLKPENIMVDRDGTVKVMDLGLCQSTAVMHRYDEKEEVIGTPAYISPEQIYCDKELDCRADIYCLGAALYHLTTGRMLFPLMDNDEILRAHVDPMAHAPDPRQLAPELSRGFAHLVANMLVKDREARLQTWDAVYNAATMVEAGDDLPAPDAATSVELDD